jgi:tryptophan 7-halogenase
MVLTGLINNFLSRIYIGKNMKITIVGGGTAAWLTTAYLRNLHPKYDITVIDKEVGTPIGVGEATILDFPGFMADCGILPYMWINEIDATLKSGILFPGWGHEGTPVWHPFRMCLEYTKNLNQWDVWAMNPSDDFKTHGLQLYNVSLENKVDLRDFNEGAYAYHVDCSKLVLFFQKILRDGIRVIRSEVIDVIKDGEEIKKLKLKNGEEHTSDLFIDCTGFKSLLKEQKRIHLDGRLFCDTAVAGHIPYEDKQKEMKPYVISEAVDHGWIWKIPVQTRIGSGLVFNRTATDIEEAKEYFLSHWNHRTTKDKLKVIDWTPYYIENFWEGNVVSIGLSGGFIEPLESTGLSLMISGVRRLSNKIDAFVTDRNKQLYNMEMRNLYEGSVDFINMHYSYVDRPEPFWQLVRKTHVRNKTQDFIEEKLRDPLYSFSDIQKIQSIKGTFNVTNWITWLAQLGVEINNPHDFHENQIQSLMQDFLKEEHKKVLRGLPHNDAIKYLSVL